MTELHAWLRVEEHNLLGKRALGAAVANYAVAVGHGVDDNVVTDGDTLDVRANLHHHAGRFMPEGRPADAGRDAAVVHVEDVRPADAARLDADDNIRIPPTSGRSTCRSSALSVPVTMNESTVLLSIS